MEDLAKAAKKGKWSDDAKVCNSNLTVSGQCWARGEYLVKSKIEYSRISFKNARREFTFGGKIEN